MTDNDMGESAYDHGEPNVIDIYAGRIKLGSVAIGRSIRALDAEGVEIGRFNSKEEARRAVMQAVILAGGRAS